MTTWFFWNYNCYW